MSKVLVTGGAGFIGSHLVDRLIDDGHEVLIIDNLCTGKEENLNKKAQFINADIAEYEKISPYFKDIEVVFHTAALARIQPSLKNPLITHRANVDGTLNVLWAAKQADVKRFVYSASSSAYGEQPQENYPLKEDIDPNPGTSPYSLTKYMGEQYCKLFNKVFDLPIVSLRYFNVYGSRQLTEGAYATVIGIFLRQRQQDQPMTVIEDGNEKRRDFTHVSDVVEANILAWKTPEAENQLFNIGFGKNYSIVEVANLIGGPIKIIPKRPAEYLLTLADNTKAKEILGWQPEIGLEQGIADLKKLYGLE